MTSSEIKRQKLEELLERVQRNRRRLAVSPGTATVAVVEEVSGESFLQMAAAGGDHHLFSLLKLFLVSLRQTLKNLFR